MVINILTVFIYNANRIYLRQIINKLVYQKNLQTSEIQKLISLEDKLKRKFKNIKENYHKDLMLYHRFKLRNQMKLKINKIMNKFKLKMANLKKVKL